MPDSRQRKHLSVCSKGKHPWHVNIKPPPPPFFFHSLLSARNSTLSLSLRSLKRVLQPLVDSKHFQTICCVSAQVADIQVTLEECENVIAFAEVRRRRDVSPWPKENVGQGERKGSRGAGTEDKMALCSVFTWWERRPPANYIKLCTYWWCHAVFTVSSGTMHHTTRGSETDWCGFRRSAAFSAHKHDYHSTSHKQQQQSGFGAFVSVCPLEAHQFIMSCCRAFYRTHRPLAEIH